MGVWISLNLIMLCSKKQNSKLSKVLGTEGLSVADWGEEPEIVNLQKNTTEATYCDHSGEELNWSL